MSKLSIISRNVNMVKDKIKRLNTEDKQQEEEQGNEQVQ